MHLETMIPAAAALVLALTATICELRTGHIPNWPTLPAAPAALALGLYQDRLVPAVLGLFVAFTARAIWLHSRYQAQRSSSAF